VILVWLGNAGGAGSIYNLIKRAEGIVISLPLVAWLLRRFARNPKAFDIVREFLLDSNIFELAVFNSDALARFLLLPTKIGELNAQSYCCCAAAGASAFLTSDNELAKVPGLSVIEF
jgi:hypothetical protein